MENEKNKVNVDDLLFSKEAAEYLNISVQRLNQLVHAGELKPIKKSVSGMLFIKSDLDKRLINLTSIATEMPKEQHINLMNMNTPFMNEVINYYTIQSLLGYSDKRAVPIFEDLANDMDMRADITSHQKDLSVRLEVDDEKLWKTYSFVKKSFEKLASTDYIVKKGMPEYPKKLEATDDAPPYLFMRGNAALLDENIISVVGSRTASPEGIEKAKRLAIKLGKANIVIASGLARGIDTAAHTAALDNGLLTIAVIGTPITKVYPKENELLQKRISEEGLLVSQFPPSSPVERWHFPMRNAVMSGISLASVIVEASETSGALKQADYALKQHRLVFIPQSALDNENIKWPKRYVKREGASSFSKIDELFSALAKAKIISSLSEQMSLFQSTEEAAYVRRFE